MSGSITERVLGAECARCLSPRRDVRGLTATYLSHWTTRQRQVSSPDGGVASCSAEGLPPSASHEPPYAGHDEDRGIGSEASDACRRFACAGIRR